MKGSVLDSYCANCGKNIVVPDFLENQEGICPFCHGTFKIVQVLSASVAVTEDKTRESLSLKLPFNKDVVALE